MSRTHRREHLPTFVFIHGTACNSSVWGPLQRELALLGHRSLAIDLPGHGVHANRPAGYYQSPPDLESWSRAESTLAGVTLDDNVDHVTDHLKRVAEHGPVIVVGTSSGGVTLSGLGNAEPRLIDRMVYLSAWCSVDALVGEASQWPEMATNIFDNIPFPLVGDPAALGVIRANLRSNDPTLFRHMKEATLADGTDDQFRALVDIMEPDVNPALGSFDSRVRAETWGTIPRSYIRLTEDRSIPVEAQDRMIREADALTPDNRFDVHSIAASHVGYFVNPEPFASVLDRIGAATT